MYKNALKLEDHERIERDIRSFVKADWIITYDDVPEIARIYNDYYIRRFDLNYSVSSKIRASELMIFKKGLRIPPELFLQDKISEMNFR